MNRFQQVLDEYYEIEENGAMDSKTWIELMKVCYLKEIAFMLEGITRK